MRRFAETILKFRVPVVVLTFLTTLILGYFLKDLSINSDILSSLSQDDPRVVLLNEVGDKSGGSSLAMVALESDDHLRQNEGQRRGLPEGRVQLLSTERQNRLA